MTSKYQRSLQGIRIIRFSIIILIIWTILYRYDVNLTGRIDYMVLYKTCMKKDDDKPNILPDTSHLGEIDTNSKSSTKNTVPVFDESEVIIQFCHLE